MEVLPEVPSPPPALEAVLADLDMTKTQSSRTDDILRDIRRELKDMNAQFKLQGDVVVYYLRELAHSQRPGNAQGCAPHSLETHSHQQFTADWVREQERRNEQPRPPPRPACDPSRHPKNRSKPYNLLFD